MNEPGDRTYKYRAFISYSHRDKKWGDWLHKALETYRVPRNVVATRGRDGPVPKKLFPIFRDREELPASADLSDQITTALRQSACLIVICSPHGARSLWVNEEILAYKRMGREDRILAIIVEGEPNASDKADVDPALECFPRALKFGVASDGQPNDVRVEPVAADARAQGDGRAAAKVKVIAGLLGVNYDALRRREERRLAARRMAATALLAATSGAGALYAWQIYDHGALVAESHPVNSTIVVDGVELGAHIKNLSLRSGPHELVAWAPDHFELRRTIQVLRGETASTRFWLESGFEWPPYTSPAIQGGLVLIPGTNETLLAHNELTRIIFLSTATGRIAGSFATPEGNWRTFLELDLGGDIGRVIVSARDAEKSGPDVLVIQARVPPKEMWRWSGPASGLSPTSSLAVVTLATASGVADLAVAGRDGRAYFLDGRTGKHFGDVEISSSPLPQPPALLATQRDGASLLTAFVRHGDVSDGAPGKTLPLQVIALEVPAGEVVWRRDYGTSWRGPSRPFAVDGALNVVLWNDTRWQAIDLATGSSRSGGALPGRLLGGPELVDLEGRGAPVLIFQFAEPSQPMLAVRATDGEIVWRGPDRLRALRQSRGPDGEMPRTASGKFLVHRGNALAAVDPRDGHVAWQVEGRPIGALIGDWNGDGQDEILVAMGGEGLLCLDDDGRILWKVHMAGRDVAPWALVASVHGGATRDILVHRHAGLIGLVHGPHELWRNTAVAAIQATPVIAKANTGEALVIQIAHWGNDVDLRAFSGTQGAILWSAKEAFHPNRGPALAELDGDGAEYVVALGARPPAEGVFLLVYRPSDGKLVRAVPVAVKGWLSGTPAVADFRGIGKSDVAFSTWDDRSIMMVDGRSGETLWRQRTGDSNMHGVAFGDLDGDRLADVAAASFDGHVYGLRGYDGKLLWKVPIEGGGWSKPVIADLEGDGAAQVLVVSATGRLYELDASTGDRLWSSHIAGGLKVAGHPVVARKDGRTIVLAPLGNAGVVAFDWAQHTELWRSPAGYPVIASPAVTDLGGGDDASVVVAAATGDVWLLRMDDGRPIWRRRIADGLIEANPIVADLDGDGITDILIAGHDFKLHAINGAGSVGAR